MVGKGATLGTLREMNTRTVLEAIVDGHPTSRAEVARRTGMAKPTVANALDALLAAGFVRPAARPPAGPHYGAVFFEPIFGIAHVLAFDIGARYVRGAVADLAGSTLGRYDLPLDRHDPQSTVRTVARVCDMLLDTTQTDPATVVASAVGVPGIVNPTDGRLRHATSQELEGFGIVAAISAALPGATEVENDVNLAALGEHWRGAGRGVDDFAFVTIGTGTGAGLVLDGRLRRGHCGAAGEIDYPGLRDPAPNSPAAHALVEVATARLAMRTAATKLIAPVTPETIFAAAGQGDPFAVEIVAEEARRIALTIAPICLVVDVVLIVLGGGVGLNGSQLLAPVRAELARLTPYPPRVEIAQLGDAATLTGAIALATKTGWSRIVAQRLVAQR